MKQVILVLLFCTSYTAWASWSTAANELVVNDTDAVPFNTTPTLMINSALKTKHIEIIHLI